MERKYKEKMVDIMQPHREFNVHETRVKVSHVAPS